MLEYMYKEEFSRGRRKDERDLTRRRTVENWREVLTICVAVGSSLGL